MGHGERLQHDDHAGGPHVLLLKALDESGTCTDYVGCGAKTPLRTCTFWGVTRSRRGTRLRSGTSSRSCEATRRAGPPPNSVKTRVESATRAAPDPGSSHQERTRHEDDKQLELPSRLEAPLEVWGATELTVLSLLAACGTSSDAAASGNPPGNTGTEDAHRAEAEASAQAAARRPLARAARAGAARPAAGATRSLPAARATPATGPRRHLPRRGRSTVPRSIARWAPAQRAR